mmetsp:Transcript_55453/g.166285  ORF Transcript_55453/g.166285 Transcript_55453/m.166285 type:complete len:271 (-) Transcript_55453:580-1392(-)
MRRRSIAFPRGVRVPRDRRRNHGVLPSERRGGGRNRNQDGIPGAGAFRHGRAAGFRGREFHRRSRVDRDGRRGGDSRGGQRGVPPLETARGVRSQHRGRRRYYVVRWTHDRFGVRAVPGGDVRRGQDEAIRQEEEDREGIGGGVDGGGRAGRRRRGGGGPARDCGGERQRVVRRSIVGCAVRRYVQDGGRTGRGRAGDRLPRRGVGEGRGHSNGGVVRRYGLHQRGSDQGGDPERRIQRRVRPHPVGAGARGGASRFGRRGSIPRRIRPG